MNDHKDMLTVRPTYPDLAGKVAVVTGGSGSIGSATCHLLAASQAKVVVAAQNPGSIDSVVRQIRAEGGQAMGISVDCTDFVSIELMRQTVEQELGGADILAAFVGTGGGQIASAQDTSERDWRSWIDGSLTATFLTVKSFLPAMIERRCGSIITMGTGAARLPIAGPSAAYAAAKSGVITYTRYLALEAGRHGIRANCISPGMIPSKRPGRVLPDERQRQMIAATPLGRLGTPEDIALAALFLASNASSWITGITLDVNGGSIMV
jgi:3-oxoacyl-[acyl-carrier protein] reductase